MMDIVKRVTPKQIRGASSRESVDDKRGSSSSKEGIFRGISIILVCGIFLDHGLMMMVMVILDWHCFYCVCIIKYI